MNCDEVRKYLSEYLDGELAETPAPPLPEAPAPPPPPSRSEIEAHLKTCHDCSRELELLRKTIQSVRSLPKRTVPADVQLQIERSIEREMLTASMAPSPAPPGAAERERAARPVLRWLYPVAAAASFLVVVGLGLYFYFSYFSARPAAEGPLITRALSSPKGADYEGLMRGGAADLKAQLKEEAASAPAEEGALAEDVMAEKWATEASQKGAEEEALGKIAIEELGDGVDSREVRRHRVEAEKPEAAAAAELSIHDFIIAGDESAAVGKVAFGSAGRPVRGLESTTQQYFMVITPSEERARVEIVDKDRVAGATAELESILVSNELLENAIRTDNTYSVNMKASQLPALLGDLSHAKQSTLSPAVSAGTFEYSLGVPISFERRMDVMEVREKALKPLTEPAAAPAPDYINVQIILQTVAE